MRNADIEFHGCIMLKIIADYLPEIHALCAKAGARRLDLFGSAARGDFDPSHSDIDFLVEFHDLGWEGSFDRYMNLKFGLEDLFGRNVDLVELSAIKNPYFLPVANRHRQVVYAA